jgi:hypothetical protein
MKKILLIWLLFSSAAFSQIQINTPTPYYICGDGVFDLTQKNTEILGNLDPNLYTLTYYIFGKPIINPESFVRASGTTSILDVVVNENNNPLNFAITSLYLYAYTKPTIFFSNNMTVFQSPNSGFATFDLTAQSTLLNNSSSVEISYYLNELDSENNFNSIANPESFTNTTNPQTIYVRVEYPSTGCYTFDHFDLIVREDGIVNILDSNFKAKLLSASSANSVASTVNPNNTSTLGVYNAIDTNQDGEIQFSEAASIVFLRLSSSNISKLEGIEAFHNLKWLLCQNNSITALDVSTLPKLLSLQIFNNDLTNLNLSSSNQLEILNCDFNQLAEIDLFHCTNLEFLSIRNNQLTNLDLNSNDNLQIINASNNSLLNIQIINKPFLSEISLLFNQLTTVTLNDLPILYKISMQFNNLTNLDLSSIAFQVKPSSPNSNSFEIDLNNNPNLTQINLKNGYRNDDISLSASSINDVNQIVCVDEFDIFTDLFTSPNSIMNTYCSFSPEGIYNTIFGSVHYDITNNGCSLEDDSLTILSKVLINDGTEEGASFTNLQGNYMYFTQNGNFTITPELENPSYFTVTPSSTVVNFPYVNNSEEEVNFCVTPTGVHPDLEVIIAPINPARPGFEATYKIVYRNKGNQTLSQEYGLSFFYNQQLMSFVSSTQTPDSQIEGTLNWSYENLIPFESRSITVTFLINAPMDSENPVNIDDELVFTAVIMPQAGDENVADNTFVLNQKVVGAYDPNDIRCIEGEVVSPDLIGEELHYVIRFENTGNFYAENVVVVVEIDETNYDVSSLKVLESSHNVRAQVKGNKAEFFFNQIYLDSGGHGNILLRMRSLNTLTNGNVVKSKADIYFDYNYPIITNEAETLFQALSIENPILDNIISIHPNPTNDIVNIAVKTNSSIKTIELYDIQGRLLQIQVVNDSTSEINLSSRANGIYFIKINTNKGSKVEKLVKN